MRAERTESNVIAFPAPVARAAPDEPAADLRFRNLVGEQGWQELPAAVRARFGERVEHCRILFYAGEIVECRMSRAGWLLAQAARLVGAPLPLSRDAFVPAAASVTEDPKGGQFWVRIYGRPRAFPQVIRSSKRFCGPTGLEEYLGRGFGIALRARVENRALHFVSDHYFLTVLGLRLRLPRWLEPGKLTVSHVDCNHGRFAFVLALDHPLFGELVRQTAMFGDAERGE